MKLSGFTGKAQVMEFFKPVEPGDFRVTLYPAGHILGSAMIYIESYQGSLLYTGDCKTPASPASEGFAIPENVEKMYQDNLKKNLPKPAPPFGKNPVNCPGNLGFYYPHS